MKLKHTFVAASLLALSVLGGASESKAITLAPVPDDLIVDFSGLEWVWASPCAVALGGDVAGGCTTPIDLTFQGPLGWRFATAAEFLLHPVLALFEDFLQPSGYKCASEYFDLVYSHCDAGDFAAGLVTSLPVPNGTLYGPFYETLLVRDLSPVPVPAAFPLLLTALGAFGFAGWRKKRGAASA